MATKRQTTAPLGQRFGRLTVTGFIGYTSTETDPHERLRWLCCCDCGTERPYIAQSLQNGDAKSCGCLQREIAGRLNRGLPGRNRKEFGHSTRTLLRRTYRDRAIRAGRAFELTNDEFRLLLEGNCHYCGQSPSNKIEYTGLHGNLVYNGIDRLDNSIGYTPANCVSCCGACNRAKGTMTVQAFVSLAHLIAGRHPLPAPAKTDAGSGQAA